MQGIEPRAGGVNDRYTKLERCDQFRFVFSLALGPFRVLTSL
jgi:hypothetical protein